MRHFFLAAILSIPLMATANPELNGEDVTAPHPLEQSIPKPSSRSVVIHFDKKGVPIEKLTYAQLVVSAEAQASLENSTPSTELKDMQAAPQWGFLYGPRWGYGGVFDNSFDAYDQGYGGNMGGYGGGYWGGFNSTVASWYQSPVYNYFFGGGSYLPVGYYYPNYGGDYYGIYEPYD